jgi:RimJ/RimL family protein N-acetyltransferase
MTRKRPARLTLRDGRAVDVRPLERTDRAGLASGIARLSYEARYQRFATAKPTVSERELDYLLDIDHHDREALLAIDPRTGDGVAVVRYVQVPGEPGVVELAATVADEWQGNGLGGALLALLIQRAREEGHLVLRASAIASNKRSIAMLRRGGFRARPGSGLLRDFERTTHGTTS